MTLIYLALAWALGIVLAARTEVPLWIPLLAACMTLPGLIYFRRDRPLLLWLLLMLLLGMLRFGLALPSRDADHVLHLNDRGVLTLEGVVIEEPEPRESNLRLLIRAEQAAGHRVNGRVLATVPRSSAVQYGDRVQLFGTLVTPPQFDTFNYQDYLARQQVFSLMPSADVVVLAQGQGSPFYAALFSAKDEARQVIQRHLPEPQSALLTGILLGDESGLSAELSTAFQRTGTSHVIAISGFNMVILATLVYRILALLFPHQRRGVTLAALLAILLYTLFVGASGAVVRAAVMSGLLIVAQLLGRRTYVISSLAFATLLLSLFNPWILWDIGFQLSLAAVVGMALFVRPLEKAVRAGLAKLLSEQTGRRLMALFSESFIVTLAAQITTTPLILYYFGRLSLVSLLVNLLIIPAQTPLLLFGAAGVLLGLVFPPLGAVLLAITWIFLSWTVAVVEAFAALPWADVAFPIGEAPFLLIMLCFLLAVLYQATRPRWAEALLQERRLPMLGARALSLAGLGLLLVIGHDRLQQPSANLHVHFLDVGHSHTVLLQSPQGASILVNGGRLPTRLLEAVGEVLPPRSRHLDLLIISNPSADEVSALTELVQRYRVGAVLTNSQTSNDEAYLALMQSIEAQAIPVVVVKAGYTVQLEDGLSIEVLYPFEPPPPSVQAPLVLRVQYGQAVFLLAGDMDASIEAQLLAQPHQLQATVLQVADHGGDSASSLPFLAVAAPQLALIQAEQGNFSNDPSPTVLDRLKSTRLYRTDQHGQIHIESDGQSLWVSTDK